MEQKSLKQNMILNITLTVSNFLFPLITFTYVARVLTPTGTGKVAFVNSIINYFLYLSMLGIPTYGLRECAKVRHDKKQLSKLVQELLIINIFATIIAYILLFTFVLLIPKFRQYKKLFIVMSIVIVLTTLGMEWLYKALEEYRYITTRSLILRIFVIPLTFLLIRSEDDYIYYGILTIFTVSASYVFNFIHVGKYINLNYKHQIELKKHFKPIVILFASTVIITIYNNFDVSMLGLLSSEGEVGFYNAALRIKSIVLSMSTAVTSVMIPRMVYYFSNKTFDKAQELLVKSLKVSMLLALPLTMYIAIFARDVLEFVCGIEYISAVPTLRILCFCVIPLILTNLFGNQVLIPLGMEKRYTKSVFVGLWVNIILNAILIFKFGSAGAAFATFITECWNVYYMSGGRKDIRKYLFKNINIFKYIIPIAISGIAAKLLWGTVENKLIVWRLMTTTIVYFGLFFTLLLILKEDIVLNTVKNILLRLTLKKR